MSKPRRSVGAVCGRFQPFHWGHAEYVRAAKELCDRLIIGITNPDPVSWDAVSESPHRHLADANPFSYYERMDMIRAALPELGIGHQDVEFVPFPILNPSLIRYYVPPQTLVFLTIYDEWGQKRCDLIRNEGLNVEVLWTRKPGEKVTTGSYIRETIRRNGLWRQCLPEGTARCLEQVLSTRMI